VDIADGQRFLHTLDKNDVKLLKLRNQGWTPKKIAGVDISF
jgi:transcriptional regulator